jgi:pimeloyl-ACP methyl ester carboxylesterase
MITILAALFMSLVHHWPTWEAVRERYGGIDRPVLLLYGDHDWSRPDEQAETARLPGETIERVVEFVDRLPATRVADRFSG